MYEGAHEPIVSKALFDAAQAVFARRWRYSPSEAASEGKPFLGLLRCAECGSAITAEVQKGHTYYRCTKKNKARPCRQPYVREEALDAGVSDMLAPYALRADWADEMLAMVRKESEQRARTALVSSEKIREEIAEADAKLERLTGLLVDGIIDREAYLPKKAELVGRKKALKEREAITAAGKEAWLEPLRDWLLTAKTVGEVAQKGTLTQKKALAEKVFGSNLVLNCKRPCGRAVKPWSLLADNELPTTLVRREGIEPSSHAWEARILPMNYRRKTG